MNEKKILIVDEEQNNVLESKIKKLLESVGIGVDFLSQCMGEYKRLFKGEGLSPCYGLAIILYIYKEKELEEIELCDSIRYYTLLIHGIMVANLGVNNVGALYLPDSFPRLNAQHFFIEVGADSHWKMTLLNRLRDSGFEIDEAKFVELAKSV